MMIEGRDCDYIDVAVVVVVVAVVVDVAVAAVDSVDGRRRTGGGQWRRHCFGGCGVWRGQQEEEDEVAVPQRD